MTKRYASMFEDLQSKQQGAFVPFVMLGDPDKDTSLQILNTLVEAGADALELGIPFSDPIADGPTIQRAELRALEAGVRPLDCLDIIAKLRQHHPDIPIGLLMYSNLVMAQGIHTFYSQAANAGVDSILVADVPLREAKPFIEIAKQAGIEQILIAPPNASEETLKLLGESSQGYTYLLGRAGVTGAETAATMPAHQLIEKLMQYQVAPPLLGFGISKPEQVKEAIAAGAAGAISGSATVNIIAENLDNPTAMFAQLSQFVRSMKVATEQS
jgi:tryptophan synthase alpha chain